MAVPARSLENLIHFPKGVSGNPAGRPKGSRNKLEEAFLRDLANDWAEHGAETIEKAREKNPVAYLSIAASLIPKKVEQSNPLEGVTREQLGLAIAAIESWIASGGAQETGSGTGGPGQTPELQTVPEAG